MFFLVESGDHDSEEENGEGMFKTNIYLANHNILFNNLPQEISIQDTGILADLFHFVRCFSNFSKSGNV